MVGFPAADNRSYIFSAAFGFGARDRDAFVLEWVCRVNNKGIAPAADEFV